MVSIINGEYVGKVGKITKFRYRVDNFRYEDSTRGSDGTINNKEWVRLHYCAMLHTRAPHYKVGDKVQIIKGQYKGEVGTIKKFIGLDFITCQECQFTRFSIL